MVTGICYHTSREIEVPGHQCRARKALKAGVRRVRMNATLHPIPERQINQHMHQLHVRRSSLSN
jgi:hypothetical protein